jgi:hypothetical protein
LRLALAVSTGEPRTSQSTRAEAAKNAVFRREINESAAATLARERYFFRSTGEISTHKPALHALPKITAKYVPRALFLCKLNRPCLP